MRLRTHIFCLEEERRSLCKSSELTSDPPLKALLKGDTRDRIRWNDLLLLSESGCLVFDSFYISLAFSIKTITMSSTDQSVAFTLLTQSSTAEARDALLQICETSQLNGRQLDIAAGLIPVLEQVLSKYVSSAEIRKPGSQQCSVLDRVLSKYISSADIREPGSTETMGDGDGTQTVGTPTGGRETGGTETGGTETAEKGTRTFSYMPEDYPLKTKRYSITEFPAKSPEHRTTLFALAVSCFPDASIVADSADILSHSPNEEDESRVVSNLLEASYRIVEYGREYLLHSDFELVNPSDISSRVSLSAQGETSAPRETR
ncbi:hypothetical protein BCR39DRAFT_511429 [Naematelia encephala]|uniref:Uncharacterized protein n=1 Tax=Naematelia encephala TaxID=71784 RepID=A0A1Y2BLR1_9TREE|nr:hypothetical protein BCR39DRAFT_511429 [Naematelia encephala]